MMTNASQSPLSPDAPDDAGKPDETAVNSNDNGDVPASATVRQYEKSGLNPANGKPFRMWALFGWLTLLIAFLAGVAAVLDLLLRE